MDREFYETFELSSSGSSVFMAGTKGRSLTHGLEFVAHGRYFEF